MSLTLLQLIQRTQRRIHLQESTEAFSASDEQTKQLVEIALDLGEDLMKRHDWQVLKKVVTFAGAATQALTADHDRFAGGAEVWDLSLDVRLYGPLDTTAWDSVIVRESNSSRAYWSLIGGVINLYPTPGGGETFRYQYVSNKWIYDASAGNALVAEWTGDGDTFAFPDRLMRLGMRHMWKQEKGLSYAEEQEDFERELEKEISRDRGPRHVATAPQFEDVPDDWWPGQIVT